MNPRARKWVPEEAPLPPTDWVLPFLVGGCFGVLCTFFFTWGMIG
jgi:hypothetical protein